MKRAENRCGWCGRIARPATGVYLRLLDKGRTVCSGCGRWQVSCDCERKAA